MVKLDFKLGIMGSSFKLEQFYDANEFIINDEFKLNGNDDD